jgi:glycine reductase
MALEVGKFYVDEVVLGADTRLDGRTLVVSRDAVRALALREAAVADLRIDVAAPGDATRIIHVLDAVPATVKVKGPGGVFPGFLAEPVPSGRGRLHRVENLAVLTCAELPWGGGGLFVAREAVIDMSGPAQALSPFGAMFNVVLNVRLAPDALPTDQEAVVRRVGLGVAAHVGRALADAVPVDVVAHGRPELPDLPRIVYIHQVHSQGLYARTFLYGQDLDTLLPTPLDPNGLLEGALVSGCYLYAAYKTPTWLHCRNPVVEQLCAGHGRDHVFAGMVLSRGFHYTTLEKQRSASYAAHVAHLLRADGVVLTWDGSGNSATDAMLTLQACERLGIKAAAIAYEMGPEDSTDPLLLDSVPEADALVSTGSSGRGMLLPRMSRVIGGDSLRLRPELGGVRAPAEGPLELETLDEVYCAAGQIGFGRLAGVAY